MSRTRKLLCGALGALILACALAGAPDALASASARRAHRSCVKANSRAKEAHRRRARACRCTSKRRRAHRCTGSGARRRHHAGHPAGKGRSHRLPQTRSRGRSVALPGSGCEGATLIPSEGNLALVREATLCLINRERARSGEPPLHPVGALTATAQAHSTSMFEHGYFEHTGADGRSPLQRIQASGYLPRSAAGYEIGENIAWGSSTLATPASIVAAWMASPPHRANILHASFRDTGIGISPQLPGAFGAGSDGALYTQDFGTILGG